MTSIVAFTVSTAGLIAMNGRVLAQASMLAYNNIFKLMLILALLCIPLALCFSKPRMQQRTTMIET